jgi:arsenate reductase
MAEAIVNARLSSEWRAFSAGTKPAGTIHPKAIQVLEEIGISHQGTSKHIDEFHNMDFDLVITICDSAAEDCPLWLGKGKRIHLGFPDPAKATGTEDELLAAFRSVRDEILRRISPLLAKRSGGS